MGASACASSIPRKTVGYRRADAVEHGEIEPRPRFGRAPLRIEGGAETGGRAGDEALDRTRGLPGLRKGAGDLARRRATAQRRDMGRAGIGRIALCKAPRDREAVVRGEIAIGGESEEQALALCRREPPPECGSSQAWGAVPPWS